MHLMSICVKRNPLFSISNITVSNFVTHKKSKIAK